MTGTHAPITERVVLVGVLTHGETLAVFDERQAELGRLLDTLGVAVAETLTQRRPQVDPVSVVGKGKLEELKDLVAQHEVQGVVFDRLLSPAQVRHLEKALNVKVLDRTGVILDIFARHARTREAAVAVELAQLRYLLPRLTGQWSHFSEQFGGLGTRGPGETQLETDKRLIRDRIHKLEQRLKDIDRSRQVRVVDPRQEPVVAVVGYTNAGKSSLLRALSGRTVHVKDELFSTLDTLKRRVALGPKHTAVLTDTVGFIDQLPHELVPSFKTTLSAAAEADLVLHVLDASHEGFPRRKEVTEQILLDVGVARDRIIQVNNKADRLKDPPPEWSLGPAEVLTSAVTGQGLDRLKTLLEERLFGHLGRYTVRLEPHQGHHLGALQRLGTVLSIEGTEQGGYDVFVEEKVGDRVAHYLAGEGLSCTGNGMTPPRASNG